MRCSCLHRALVAQSLFFLSAGNNRIMPSCLGFVHKAVRLAPTSPSSRLFRCNSGHVSKTLGYSTAAHFRRHWSDQLTQLCMQQSSAASTSSAGTEDSIRSRKNALHHDAHLWFSELLPEGWCVGVCTASGENGEKSPLDSTMLLHPDEAKWGKDNIKSDSSRTSHFLGRMALRLSLTTLVEGQMDAAKNTTTSFYSQLRDQIQSTAIIKDYYGRPILPEIITGSISHKGECAVGLSRFRTSPSTDPNRAFWGLDNQRVDPLNVDRVQWKEECPLLEEDEIAMPNENGDVAVCSSGTSVVRGVGIDLERIDGKRGKRIERKVLTENERTELGRLEGVSREEEVMLRFSLKESVYKAMHPIICQYVGFQEAEITPLSDGTAQTMLNLTSGAHEQLEIVVQSASWKKVGDFFLTSASVGTALAYDEQ